MNILPGHPAVKRVDFIAPRRIESKAFQLARKEPNMRGLGITLMGIIFGTAAPAQPSPQTTAATLDRMTAAGKSPRELAQYVFDTHGCKSCHTVGQNGKLGFTERGKQIGKGFEGCISMLTAMNLIAQVPDPQRSLQERQKAARFQEFGCTFCHKIIPGKMGLTDVGVKLTHLHLGCADVEKLLASNTQR
jgi:cytochrome c551/c552